MTRPISYAVLCLIKKNRSHIIERIYIRSSQLTYVFNTFLYLMHLQHLLNSTHLYLLSFPTRRSSDLDGYFLDKLEPIPSALPSFQKLFQVSATALSIP